MQRMINKSVTINGSVNDVWSLWTTKDGLERIARKVNVDLSPGGAYEWFLDLDAGPDGRRGSEGSYVIAVHPPHLLVFSWTFPPEIEDLRLADARTQVAVQILADRNAASRVDLWALGWGNGASWDRGYAYFDKAWSIVLQEMQKQFTG